MTKLVRNIANWTAAASGLCLVVLMVITFLDVMGRYFFGAALPFTVEVVQLGMGLIVFLGLALTTLDNGHISVDVVSAAVLENIGKLFAIIGALCSILFFALVAWQLWVRAMTFRKDGLTTEILLVKVYPVALVMAIAAGFATLICIYLVFRPREGGE